MKKAIRIIVPIILVIAILAGIYWYLFIYDRAFTREMLLSTARYFERQGEQSIAAWFYDRAYEQGDGSDAVAIELARQYVKSGNYTKAEQTLYRAIRDGGGAEVYVALSEVFVKQDKLIDALDLLDNIPDEEIAAQLDAMRPAAPVAQQEPGFYNQHISVSIVTDGSTLYVNTAGEYPTIGKDLYTAPIKLHDGENVLCAIAVGSNGLVSPAQMLSYTVGGVVEPMDFVDAAMEAAIRTSLNLSDEVTVYTNDLWNIHQFTIPADASDYSDLKHMIFLESLTITDGVKGQLQVLAELSSLKTLSITGTSVSSDELKIVGSLASLESLTLNNCNLSTSAGLAGNTKLKYLDLGNNAIRNIDALSGMTSLEEVCLKSNALTDISVLSSLSMLTKLDVSYNSLTSLAPICSLSKLSWLDASTNQINNLGKIAQLQQLAYLNVSSNSLSSLSNLSGCSGLQTLYIANNQLTDISPLASLTKLTYLDFSHNSVTSLPQWPMNCALVTIDGSYNNLTDLSRLSGLTSLNNVLMDYNSGIKSVNVLANCPNLVSVNVYGTKVTDVSSLTAQNIIVNYNPVQ